MRSTWIMVMSAGFAWSATAHAQPAAGGPAPGAPALGEPAPGATAPAPLPAPGPAPSEPPPVPATPPTPPPTEPAVKPAPAPAALAVTYDKGIAFAAADGTFGLRLGFRNQLRFESLRATEDGSQFQSRFSIPRSRLQAEGHVFGKGTRYKLEFGLGDAGSFSFVKDLYIDQQLAPSTWLRAGQWKRPFNRQELVSDFASEFNERANTATFVGGGRDLGIAVHNDYEKSPEGLEWIVGVFNGFSGGADRPSLATTCTQNPMTSAITCATPTPSNFPTDFGPAVVARAGWNIGKIKGYSEGDLEGGPLRVAIGASYKIDLANFSKRKEATVVDNLSHGLQADLMLKVEGFGLELGAYMMKLKSADAGFGVLVEPSYFVVPKRVQVAARFAYAPVAARKQIEARAALNYFLQGHAWKWATDIGVLQLTGEDPTTMVSDKPDLQVRSMLQLTL